MNQVTLVAAPLVALGSALLVRRRVIAAALVFIALTTFGPSVDLPHTTLNLGKIALLAAIACLAWHHRRSSLRCKEIWQARESRFLLGLLVASACANALTSAAAHYLEPVLRETAKACEYFLVAGFGLFAGRQKADRDFLRNGLTAILLLTALWALSEEFSGAHSVFRAADHLVPRVAGPLEGPNQLAAYLGLGLPVLYALSSMSPNLVLLSTLTLAMIAEILTFSRAGIATSIIALGIVARCQPYRCSKTIFAVLVGLIGGFGIAFGLAGSGIGHLASVTDAGDTGGVGHRSQLWRAAILLWQRSPWLGIGAGNYEHMLPSVGLYHVQTHANSLYLQALAEGGVFLESVTLASVVMPLVLLARGKKRDGLILGTFAAGIGFALHNCVDTLTFFPKIGVFWWFLVGLSLSPLAERRDSNEQDERPNAVAAKNSC